MLTKPTRLLPLTALVLFAAFLLSIAAPTPRPTLYLIGDSTVKNGQGRGDGGLWGWGNYLPAAFDTTRLRVENDARGGTSSRTFRTQGWWEKVRPRLKPGDYVIMQFGHNDSSPLTDSTRARGTIRSNGDESQEVFNYLTKEKEVVHSYGWYLRQLIADAQKQGATVVVCSPIPRNSWAGGKVNRSTADYGKWAAEAARQAHVTFIDLNQRVADKYDRAGETQVKSTYFNTVDHTHTIEAGAKLNAEAVAEGIREAKGLNLKKYLKK
ncbi:rhamnogalacturonan acetylesterase [Hymenobacter sp. UV11]|uniref:rhamnogalacturonan acetylesterase n=1 Tax=Hymenobacter sp. UV11 TaxID=1849735 RepID=UPI001061A10D|nr:rhamnogalacturonan acetylesterase [Hymenobacter sp. UV11]TDN35886.1 lysophospholipase [Hymenobacter sp. UV11]TFZ68310.1 rhamnogalacturonan acetylesterase [Hymenobacter sp. UV11]